MHKNSKQMYCDETTAYLDFLAAALDNKLERSVPFLPSVLFLLFIRAAVSLTKSSMAEDTDSHFSFS